MVMISKYVSKLRMSVQCITEGVAHMASSFFLLLSTHPGHHVFICRLMCHPARGHHLVFGDLWTLYRVTDQGICNVFKTLY